MSLSHREQEILDALEMDLRRSGRFGRHRLTGEALRVRHRLVQHRRIGVATAVFGTIVMLWQLSFSLVLSFVGFLLGVIGLWMADAGGALGRLAGRVLLWLRTAAGDDVPTR